MTPRAGSSAGPATKRRTLKHDFLSFFRALIPTWGFFDDFEGGPQVFLRTKMASPEESAPWSEWSPAFLSTERNFWTLFFNPEGTKRLLEVSTFERLTLESQEFLENPEALSESTTYQLCTQILCSGLNSRLVSKNSISKSFCFQFKIRARLDLSKELPYQSQTATATDTDRQDAFLSKVHLFS